LQVQILRDLQLLLLHRAWLWAAAKGAA